MHYEEGREKLMASMLGHAPWHATADWQCRTKDEVAGSQGNEFKAKEMS
jgi:hypothetical protein